MFNRKAVFLDRDGTVVKAIRRPGFPQNSSKKKEITAPFKLEEVEFYPDASKSIKTLRDIGFLAILVTNQPDVAHGYLSYAEWLKIYHRIIEPLGLNAHYFCPHTSEANCSCKKPLPGMIFKARDRYGIDLSQSYMIGDTDADMKAGKAAGCGTILLDRDYNQDVVADIRVATLEDAVKVIRLSEKMTEQV